MDDQELIAAVAAGDDAALRELFTRHAPWLAGQLRRLMPADAVEDAVQETFIAVWRGAKGYSGEGAVGAWLWGIGRRQAALWFRKHGRSEALLDAPVAAGFGPDVERQIDLEQALAGLGPDGDQQRELVRLVYVEDRPLGEVAHLLGIPPGTVKSRLFTVRKRLRAALERTE